jgi:ADP-ribose pyrophosphatase YjhB (NUDIX family)
LWEFPGTVRRRGEMTEAAAVRGVREGLGLEVEPGEAIGTVRHAFTHLKASYHALRCRVVGGELRVVVGWEAAAWVAPEEIKGYALPVAQQKVARLATERTRFSG